MHRLEKFSAGQLIVQGIDIESIDLKANFENFWIRHFSRVDARLYRSEWNSANHQRSTAFLSDR